MRRLWPCGPTHLHLGAPLLYGMLRAAAAAHAAAAALKRVARDGARGCSEVGARGRASVCALLLLHSAAHVCSGGGEGGRRKAESCLSDEASSPLARRTASPVMVYELDAFSEAPLLPRKFPLSTEALVLRQDLPG